ncbi:hypothetical protein, partial [Pseudodesulfovibrio sp. JC047]|uniref:hypothetical protein n=1 Tax=Pseudodesulfovibrio sp. JC047 TaxID=2683199 RepID=UPI00193F4192
DNLPQQKNGPRREGVEAVRVRSTHPGSAPKAHSFSSLLFKKTSPLQAASPLFKGRLLEAPPFPPISK